MSTNFSEYALSRRFHKAQKIPVRDEPLLKLMFKEVKNPTKIYSSSSGKETVGDGLTRSAPPWGHSCSFCCCHNCCSLWWPLSSLSTPECSPEALGLSISGTGTDPPPRCLSSVTGFKRDSCVLENMSADIHAEEKDCGYLCRLYFQTPSHVRWEAFCLFNFNFHVSECFLFISPILIAIILKNTDMI